MTQPDLLWRRVRAARCAAPAGQPVVLVVDSDPDVRLLVQYALRHDATVDVARSAATAVRIASDRTYDAVLVNLALPDATGLVVLKRLRFRAAAYRDVPVVALADHALPGDDQRTRQAGFDAHIAKPLRPESVRASLWSLLLHGDRSNGKPEHMRQRTPFRRARKMGKAS